MRFYVYDLIGPDGSVFYIGKGQGKRMYQHRAEAKSGHGCHKCNKIRKIWREGGDYTELVVFQTDDERAALDKEMELIATTPNLCNATIGGEGIVIRPEVRHARSIEADQTVERIRIFEESQRKIKSLRRKFNLETGLAELDRKLKEARK